MEQCDYLSKSLLLNYHVQGKCQKKYKNCLNHEIINVQRQELRFQIGPTLINYKEGNTC